MGPADIAILCTVIIAFALVSRRIESLPITMPMVMTTVGLLMAISDIVDVTADTGSIALLAEVTLAMILFSDAVRIDLRRLRRHLQLPARLLGIGLPLTIVLGTLIFGVIYPDQSWATVALVAAILSPTDAALGSAVIEDESVPTRDRLALNVESGVNDGMVVPIVAIFTAAVLDEQQSTRSWIGFVLEQIGWGIVLGVVIGSATVLALRWAHGRGWSDGRYEQLATFAVPILALTAADVLGGNGFIAAFVAGLAFGFFGVVTEPGARRDVGLENPNLALHFVEFSEDAAQLLALLAFFVFGNVLLGEVPDLDWRLVVGALLALTVMRMLPVWISLFHSGLRLQTKTFLGWFGPRGLASILFGLLLLEDFEGSGFDGSRIFDIVSITVTASILLHGATAAWGARSYGRWAESADMDDDEREEMEMPELEEMMPKSRWG
jgi:NhaP-type Na+/H+ or K+/H+ antiporter